MADVAFRIEVFEDAILEVVNFDVGEDVVECSGVLIVLWSMVVVVLAVVKAVDDCLTVGASVCAEVTSTGVVVIIVGIVVVL